MNFFRNSLGAKILGLTAVVLVVVFGILFSANFLWQQSATVHEVELNAVRTAELVSMAIREPMALGDNDATTKKFAELGAHYNDIDIHLTNFKGNTTYSTKPELLRQQLTERFTSPELAAMLKERLRTNGISHAQVDVDGSPYFIEVKSIPNEPACHHCHGRSQEVLGAMVMRQDLSRQMAGLWNTQLKSGAITAVGMLVLLAALSVAMRILVVNRVRRVAAMTERISQGDLTASITVCSGDELGQLSSSVNTMTTNVRSMMAEILRGVDTLASSSHQLTGVSNTVAGVARDNQHRADTVAQASEEMSANMRSVAAATEEATVNISTVAAASEEMSATIDEISRNTSKAKDITAVAVNVAHSTSGDVDRLGKVANEIHSVTQTITAISSQTNLLALNATIEAARAGEAGRGFAVVANEIKELANQTARATEEIRSKISGIQDATDQTVHRIAEITHVITDIDAIVTTIAAAVEEQSVTTRDIAENVGQASMGLAEVNQNVAQTTAVATEITEQIGEVSLSATEMTANGDTVRQHAEELRGLSEQLKGLVHMFRVE